MKSLVADQYVNLSVQELPMPTYISKQKQCLSTTCQRYQLNLMLHNMTNETE